VSGIVYLVGAGPGDPRLLTLRGAEVLRSADVVVYDRLASPALLDLAPSRAERVYVGKEPGGTHVPQSDINRLLIRRARDGKTVVRLKGGDPFVFGRGGEEALACAGAGVPCRVVPGVTSAVSAPASAGIPLTHRGLARSFAVVTASARKGEEVDLSRIATAVDTLVVLMVAERLGDVCGQMVAAGRPPSTPAAVVQAATTSEQHIVIGTLETLPGLAGAASIGPPATLVVGDVAALASALGQSHSGPERRLAGGHYV
jgi:uroporphyrin-III C-methyltransferase